ncbi:hypothetical protein Taro_020547 [Colocasia esculenta]|uniref:Uncharacterized protein n=1 Tax=Colocasia esculenta TaxID=4460 RepID=A0A843UWL9_COLES|nr:hypothetical protein [Colocasia esculenta]
MAKGFSPRCCEEERRVAVWVKDYGFSAVWLLVVLHSVFPWKGSCNFFMWCGDFLAFGPSCSAKCQCNRDQMMQKLVQENEILRKWVQELQLQLEKKTMIVATLARVISTMTTDEADN